MKAVTLSLEFIVFRSIFALTVKEPDQTCQVFVSLKISPLCSK